MKSFIYSLMTDKRRGAVYLPFKAALCAASFLYGMGLILRRILYKMRIFDTRRAPLKVISVGNVTLGGTGKTPFTITLAGILEENLKKNTCVLIRGYGWDEQEMLRRNLSDVPVIVGEDRLRSAYRAVKLYASDTAILDDGFQHWELARDLDIVLVDSRNPFGNGRLFPRGVLREPRASLARADMIVLTKTDCLADSCGSLRKELESFNEKAVFLEAVHRPKYFYEGRARRVFDLSHAAGKRVILLSSIGDPLYFEETVKGLGAEIIEHMNFPDHHDYKKSDVDRVMGRCDERSFDFVVTTEKDIVKLSRLGLFIGSYRLLTLAIEMEITRGKEILLDRLHSLYTR